MDLVAPVTRFSAAIDQIHIHAPGEVHFGGAIVRSAEANLVGKFAHVVVIDGGTPGRKGDLISVVVSDSPMHADGVTSPVTRGDLTVRTRS